MRVTAPRLIAVAVALIALTACSEQSPVAPLNTEAAFASGRSGGVVSKAGRMEITLARTATSPFAAAKGKARYSAKSSERELQVEVENVPAGTVITFLHNGVAFGTATASALGEARLNLNSTLGQSVPMVSAGSAITATTAAGVTIVAGTF